MNQASPPLPYPEIGHCIYCGATRYSTSRRRLGDEHIIPKALGGTLILKRASCQRCERIINKKAENPMLRGNFLLARHRLNMRVKTKRKAYPINALRGEWLQEEEFTIVDTPEAHVAGLAMLDLPRPRILDPSPRDGDGFWPWWILFDPPDKFTDGVYREFGNIHLNAYARFFSKIAYAFACAVLGPSGFQAIIRDRITEQSEPPDFTFVGGIDGGRLKEEPNHFGHHLLLCRQGNILLVAIRLFVQFEAPLHIVAVGTLAPHCEAPENIPVPHLDSILTTPAGRRPGFVKIHPTAASIRLSVGSDPSW